MNPSFLLKKVIKNVGLLKDPIYAVKRFSHELYRLRHSDEPWISQGAVQFCDEHLDKDMVAFEWGSGSSTTWFARRVKKITSIEYDQEWHKVVSKQLRDSGFNNIDLIYIPLDHSKSEPTPTHYDPLPQYVDYINKFPDESFDLIVIDGHYRWTCALASFKKIKPGGYLLIDNSERSSREEWNIPKNWKVLHESRNLVTQTTIWQKPLRS